MAKVVRRNVAFLAKKLRDPEIMRDYFQQRNLFVKVLDFASQGEDLSAILPSMVKLLAHPDLCVKKMAGEVLIQHSGDNAEMVLLAINTLVQDFSDSNPMARGLALRTLSSLQQECVAEHLERAVTHGLSDSSAYVRRAAVLACVRLHRMSPSFVHDTGIVDRLYGMIRDSDPIVVVNCLSSLEEVLREEGGIVINKNIAHYLLSKLHSHHTWVQIQMLQILTKYQPGSEDELFDILNVLDGCLEHNSPTVVTTAIQLFMSLLENLPHLQTEIYKRAKTTIVGHLGSGNTELSCTLIDLISKASEEAVFQFSDYHQSFFCRNKDPPYLKGKKISFLPRLVSEENGHAILEELSLYCVDSSRDVSLQAIQAVGNLMVQHPTAAEACKKKLVGFCHSSSPHILSNVLQVIQDLNPFVHKSTSTVNSTSGCKYIPDDTFWENIIVQMCFSRHKITDDSGKAALLYVLGEHGQNSAEVLSVLEEYVEEFCEIDSRDVKIELITTTTKLFLHHPAECQSLLGGLFELAMDDSDLEVQSRTEFLYCLLERGIDLAKAVLLSTVNVSAYTGLDYDNAGDRP